MINAHLHPGEQYLHVGINVLKVVISVQPTHVRQSVSTIDDEDESGAMPEGHPLASEG